MVTTRSFLMSRGASLASLVLRYKRLYFRQTSISALLACFSERNACFDTGQIFVLYRMQI